MKSSLVKLPGTAGQFRFHISCEVWLSIFLERVLYAQRKVQQNENGENDFDSHTSNINLLMQ